MAETLRDTLKKLKLVAISFLSMIGMVLYSGTALGTEALSIQKSDSSEVVSRPRLGDRVYIYNKLISIYGKSGKEFLEQNLLRQGSALGGPCDVYEQVRVGPGPNDFKDLSVECPNGKSGSRLPTVPRDSVVREGVIYLVCKYLSDKNEAMSFAVEKLLKKNLGISPDSADVVSFHKKFNPASILPEQDAQNILKKISSFNLSPENQWRALSIALCMDLKWQIL